MKIIGHTQIDNDFIEMMHKYKEYDIKIFLAISRKTIGWHKDTDRISYSQLKKMTGLCVNSIKKGIKNLILDGWITQIKTPLGFEYDLNIISSGDTVEQVGYHAVIQGVSCGDTVEPKSISCGDTTKEKNIKKLSKEKQILPKSVQEVIEYVKENNLKVDPEYFYKYFNDSDWIDSKGKKVYRWKQKILTWNKLSFNGKSLKDTPALTDDDIEEIKRKYEESRKKAFEAAGHGC